MSDVSHGQAAVPHPPALIQLSAALPSSVARLGLTFTRSPNPTATAATTPNNTSTAGGPSPSFRVNAIHFDDVAQDAILVCEDSITLFVPLHCDAAQVRATPVDVRGAVEVASPSSSSMGHEQSEVKSAVPAVAACLRLGNPHQAWTAAATPAAAAAGAAAAAPPRSRQLPLLSSVVGERCFPRRLPLPPAELRRAASVFVAVPVLSLPSSTTSAAAAAATSSSNSGQGSGSTMDPRTVLSIVIVECAVLPEGVDMIAPEDIPIARPLRKIVCAPNTLRFREAWYPLHLFCWCGPRETLGECGGSSSISSNSSVHHQAQQWEGYGGENALDSSSTDYHLLCVSSICVDLLRVRHTTPSHSIRGGHSSGGDGGAAHTRAPDITTMLNAGHAASLRPPSTPVRGASPTSAAPSPSTPNTPPAAVPEVTVSVVQRYVTHTDWCTYEPRSRVLLSLNYTRPSVLKPMAVHYDRAIVAESAAATAEVRTSLIKWSELVLPESLCTSLLLLHHPHDVTAAAAAALPMDERLDRLLPRVVGLFTAYGLTFLYHVPAPPRRDSNAEACMNIYLYLPHDTLSAAAKGRSSGGVGDSESGGSAPTSPTTSPASAATDSAGSSVGSLKRWAVAASSASASAPPPTVSGGFYILVAKLSLRELLPATSSIAATPSHASPLGRDLHQSNSTSAAAAAVAAGPSAPWPHPLSVQVCDNILLVHNPRTGKSVLFDVAERSPESRGVTARGDGQVTARDHVLWALASERSRRWARQHHATPAATGSGAAAADARSSDRGISQGDAAWSRAAGGDWLSMVSAVAGSVLDLSSAVGSITAGAATADLSVPLLQPLCCCGATVNSGETGSALIAEEVSYAACVWPHSSRFPLAIDRRDGSLRACRVDVTALAEWLLVVRTSHFTSSPAGQASVALPDVVSAASVGQLQAFACRHPSIAERKAEETTEETSDCGGVAEFVKVLGDLTIYLVRGVNTATAAAGDVVESGASAPSPHGVSSSYGDVVRRHLPSAQGEGAVVGHALFDYWGAMLDGWTTETEVVERCDGVAQRRMLAPVSPRWQPSRTQTPRRGRSGARLQQCLVREVWGPLWETLTRHHTDNAATEESEEQRHAPSVPTVSASAHIHSQQPQQWQRCGELMCAHVRLLHRLAVPVLPPLQDLLLAVVLKCDLESGALLPMEAPAAVPPLDSVDAADAAIAAFRRGVGRTARRVRELLRVGVLEEDVGTARTLLGWWERYRLHVALLQQQRKESCACAAPGTRDDRSSDNDDDDSAAAEWVFQTAVRLLEIHQCWLEVAEAYRWRCDYTAAAALLLRLPRTTTPVEVWEVHGARRSRVTSTVGAGDPQRSSSASTSTSALTAAAAGGGGALSAPQRSSRLLTWDTLAVAVLDGAWTAVREAEEGCYVLAEQADAAARSSPVFASPTSPSAEGFTGAAAAAAAVSVNAAPPPWQLRAAERAVQAAHRVYLNVATTVLTAPGVHPAAAAAAAAAVSAAVAGAESTTEFHPSSAEETVRVAHPRFNPVSSCVSAGYHAHEVRYLQLRQQVEADGHHMRSGGAG